MLNVLCYVWDQCVHAHQSDFHTFNSDCSLASSYLHISLSLPLCQHWHFDSLPSATYQCFSALLAAKVEERQATMTATFTKGNMQHTAAPSSSTFQLLIPSLAKVLVPGIFANAAALSVLPLAQLSFHWLPLLQPLKGYSLDIDSLCRFLVIRRGYLSLGSKRTSLENKLGATVIN